MNRIALPPPFRISEAQREERLSIDAARARKATALAWRQEG